MASPIYCEPPPMDEAMPPMSVPLIPTWLASPFYDEGSQSTQYTESTRTPFPSSMPAAASVFWGVPPGAIGWESEHPQEDSCLMPPVGRYGNAWSSMHPPTAPSSLHSSCSQSFHDDDSRRSLSPMSPSLREEFYTPPGENYYGVSEYYMAPEHPTHSPDCIAPQEVQFWHEPSIEDQLTHPPEVYESRESYPTPPEIKVESDAHSSFMAASHAQNEIFEDGPIVCRLSPLSACHSASSKSSSRSSRSAKVIKPRIKTRAKPARATKRVNRDSDGSIIDARGSTYAAHGQCPHCSQTFKNNAMLQKHISVTHTRPFSCVFSIYGCSATFGSKNEWKRHVASQHLRLSVWRCNQDSCQPRTGSSDEGDGDDDEEAVYNIFNRKDLFSQHLRRLHVPAELAAPGGDKAALGQWLALTAQECLVEQRRPPERVACGFCDQVFEGLQAWELRMEHVGRHLEGGLADEQRWREDIGLRDWMAEQGLLEQDYKGRWVLANEASVPPLAAPIPKDTRGR